jgi:hypothetical protein
VSTTRPAAGWRSRRRAAIEAIARRFSARWDGDAARAHVTTAGKRIALELVAMSGDHRAPPRLRLDRVAVRVIEDLRSTLEVPTDVMVLVTITAPIRLASKTASAIAGEARALLARKARPGEARIELHGNAVRIRLATAGRATAKVIGFVHNPDADPGVLLDTTEWMAEHLRGKGGARADRWLVLMNEGDASRVDTYRHIHAQLQVPTRFARVLMVFGDGRVEALE